jgi:16S rRNA processing protein RimM
VQPHNSDSELLFAVERLFVGERDYEVLKARPGSKGAVLVALRGIGDRDAAAALRGATVSVRRSDLNLAEGEYLVTDLVGCRVELEDGTSWGTVAEVAVGLQDRLIIHDGPVERQLPVVPEFVVAVDLPARRIVVAPPEGLPEAPR